jgi:hypothetical protein
MSGPADKLLTPSESQLLEHLATGMSLADAAEAMGSNYQTVYKWMKRPHVQAAYEELTKDIATLVRKQIEGLASTAVTALKDSLTSARAPMVKFSAATYVLNRVAPESLLQAQNEQSGPVPAELLPFVHEDELAQIDAILARAQERKTETEEKITPIRKQA